MLAYDQSELHVHWGPMVRVAHSVLGSWDEAEECAAEAMAQVVERKPTGIRNLEAFLVTVARRRALDRYRTLDRDRRRDSALAGRESAVTVDAADDVATRDEARWMEREARRRLTPRAYRLLRAAADGQALSGIAYDERLTVRAVQSSLQRSRTLLREVWARTLVVVGAALAVARRSFIAAAPIAVAAVVLTMLTLLPHSQTEHSPEQPHLDPATPLSGQFQIGRQQASVTSRQRKVIASGPAVSARHRVDPDSPSRRTVLVVPGPAGTSTTVDDRKHGSGPDATLIGGLVECLQNLVLSRENIGC